MEQEQSNFRWVFWALGFSVALGVPTFFILKNKGLIGNKSKEDGLQGESNTTTPSTGAVVDLKDQAWTNIERLVQSSNFDSFEWQNPEKTKCKFRVLDVSFDTDDMYAEMTKSGAIDFFEEGVFYETDGTRKNGYWSYEERDGKKSFCINMKSQVGSGCWQDFRGIVNAVLKANYPQYATEIK